MKTYSISFAVSENEIAYAVLDRQKLVFWEVHSFLSDPADMLKTVSGALQRCVDRFAPNAVLLETITKNECAASRLHAVIKDNLRSLGIPTCQTGEQQLLSSFGLPALRNRQELRRTIAAIFPELPFARYTHLCLDAAALGLHFETNRLLALNQMPE